MSSLEKQAKTLREWISEAYEVEEWKDVKLVRLEVAQQEIDKRERHIHGLNLQRKGREEERKGLEARLNQARQLVQILWDDAYNFAGFLDDGSDFYLKKIAKLSKIQNKIKELLRVLYAKQDHH
uniref:Uncharacterized protein n=1 Tax=viral metagenome TaxID=1070528 RepID=A0A6M3JC99_9ZZZZ